MLMNVIDLREKQYRWKNVVAVVESAAKNNTAIDSDLVENVAGVEIDYAERDELEARRALLVQAMEVLTDREKDILTQRRLAEQAVTLEELSGQYDVSRERIRQIEVRAFEKLQKRMRDLAKEQGMLNPA